MHKYCLLLYIVVGSLLRLVFWLLVVVLCCMLLFVCVYLFGVVVVCCLLLVVCVLLFCRCDYLFACVIVSHCSLFDMYCCVLSLGVSRCLLCDVD